MYNNLYGINNNNNKIKTDGIYYAYLRKSREDLELEKIKKHDTLKQHEKFIKDLANTLGVKISKTFKEVVSGESIQDRPEMQKLLKEVETGIIDGVLVVEVERLTRGDSKDQGTVTQTFKYSNTKIITLNKIYDPSSEEDEEYFEFGLFMSRREYKTINRRLQRGRMASVLDGKYCGSKPPFGYKKIKLQGKGYTLEPIEEEASIIKLIFQKRADGVGFNIICNWLNTLDIKPSKSDVWTSATIRDIISNPIYIGKIRWNNSKTIRMVVDGKIMKKRQIQNKENIILVEGLHKAIIDEKTFNLANNIKTDGHSTKKGLDLQNPLAGIVRCANCGRVFVRRPYYSKIDDKAKIKRKYPVEKEKLRVLLREHKKDLSLNQISRSLNITKNVVSHWFATSLNSFSIPYPDKWFELKKLLNIETNEFDESITVFEEVVDCPHEDTLICNKPHCSNIGSNLSYVEEAIVNALKDYLYEQKKYLSTYETVIDNNSNIKYTSLNKELEKSKNQLNKAYELVEQGIYTSLEFAERTKVIKDRIKVIEKELSKEKLTQDKEKLINLLPKIEQVVNSYYNVDNVVEKNELLKSVISYADYKKEKGGRGYEKNFTIAIHPRI